MKNWDENLLLDVKSIMPACRDKLRKLGIMDYITSERRQVLGGEPRRGSAEGLHRKPPSSRRLLDIIGRDSNRGDDTDLPLSYLPAYVPIEIPIFKGFIC